MPIGSDFSIATNGDIRYTGSGDTYSVIEFHRWLGDLMDDAQASGDDILDITSSTASDRSTDNIITLLAPYNIDDDAAEYLYDGSIIQYGGDEIYDGLVVISAPNTPLEIVQNGAKITPNFWGTALNADPANGISHRFMVKVRTGGADIDGRRLIAQTRGFGFTYSEFRINGTSRGNNVAALTYATDLNNQTAVGTVATWTGITNLTQGYVGLDINADSSLEYFYSEWDKDIYTINQFYERMKWLTRAGSSSTLYGLNGELFRGITHEVNIVSPTGTFDAFEAVSWGTGPTAGTGQMLAINSPTAGTKMWIQLLTGVAPSASVVITGASSSATATNSGSPIERTLSFPFCGQSTGSSIIGSYGFGIEESDLTANDRLFDLTNTQYTPPNNVTFTVLGLVNGEDRVLVGPESGGNLNVSQFSLNTTLSGAAETSVVVGSAIPSDTPSSGTIRIELDSGIYRRVEYTSWTGSTFTIVSSNFTTDNATSGNNVYISYIDKLAASSGEAFTVVFNANRNLFIRVRDGGMTPIKTFETTGTLTAAGGSATVIRTSDV
jgi:hypothetical protein